ncbi:MAG: PhzF family phenazine biosynthesis protein [Actinomycetota bacterium]|nr:PhzF family phenazine biosynthesis protein [Actinomycetota bacterium]
MQVRFRLVDVFTETPFAGNQLCVVTDPPADLDESTMLTLAREIGFSETTFVTDVGENRYRMRIFTPERELPFAGHPTLGTAFTLVDAGSVTSPLVQITAVGEVPVAVDLDAGFAWMTQRRLEFGPEFNDRELLARAASLTVDDLRSDLPAQVVSTGLGPLLIPVRDEATLRCATRDEQVSREAADASGGECLYYFAIRGHGDVLARMFDPYFGIGEDPATGSAAGPLGAYLAARGLAGMPGRVVIAQGEMVGRPSFLHVDVQPDDDSWDVRVGGGVRIVGEGSFDL